MISSAHRALIADDEPHLAQHLKAQLEKLWPELAIVAVANNGIDAAALIAEHEPELAFLDIRMPGMSGLEVAQGIEGRTRAVFVTAYDEYAVQAFEHAALDYLLKPLRAERLQRTVERVRAALDTPPQDDAALAQALRRLLGQPAGERLRYLRAGKGGMVHNIAVGDVLFFQADDKYTVVRTAGDEYLIRTPIAELTARLDPDEFWQVHRATVINLAHLAGTRRDEASRLFLRMRGFATELPVSRAYVPLFAAM
ncbi:LytTR family DNA-binding domain-containing protein [Massilia sp. YIM B02769]|jgi:DNA-binding LytR/AlgR family response regulator|uniref:LytR/AlgR family response regulator transcription factor n=1 Tax=unclassified Massilia TaxID=2609279 RepID=UPI0025B6D6DC|nr:MULTISPECIES: LytTR family DNA-binding domain-containing protein [unclassified Massilia]MDN4060542.1 LytTR family DNA-binding domain-containing protein [Massilia sp. YIM B02769]